MNTYGVRWTTVLAGLAAGAAWMIVPAAAQEQGGGQPPSDTSKQTDAPARLPGTARPEVPRQDPDMSPYDDERPDRNLPPGLRRDYPYPDPHLPFGYRNSPPVARYYQWNGRPYGYGLSDRYPSKFYSYDYGYGAYWRGLDPYDPYLYERAYRQGVTDGRRFEQFEREVEMGLTSYLDAMEAGQDAFSKGEYGRASQMFTLAARLNQGDPASRVCAGNALVALHRYAEAAEILRRAFELQPRMAYLPMDIRGEYGKPEDFMAHLQAVSSAAQAAETAPTPEPSTPAAAIQVPADASPAATEPVADPAELWALLGYMHLFGGNPGEAKKALDEAMKLRPDDGWIRTLHDAARMSTPAR